MTFNIDGNTPGTIRVLIGGETHNASRFDVEKDGNTTTVWVAFTTKTFEYTGDIQVFTAPITGTYKLEVWGAQGAYNRDGDGLGGYSYGDVYLTAGQTLYVCVGSQDGYNGGGTGWAGAGSGCGNGGGATHIATTDLGLLANYEINQDSVLIVAGGGGGAGSYGSGYAAGTAGGGTGGGGSSSTSRVGSFGQGGSGGSGGSDSGYSGGAGGGGGGWLGGNGGRTSNGSCAGGGGGSGYIGGVADGDTINGQREGDGYAKITLVA